MDTRLRSAAWNALESLECRQLLANISGTVIEDLDFDTRRDGRERGQSGITVFLDQNMNRQFDSGESSTTTDANGFYEFTGLAQGQYFVAQLPPANFSQNYPPKGGHGTFAGDFDLQLRFTDEDISTKARSLFESAAARWEKVLVGDLPDVETDEFGLIDDILIDARAEPVDGRGGVLASAGPREAREAGTEGQFLPYRGTMRFDTADSNQPGLFDTIIHEMGHALGFTLSTWLQFDDPVLVAGTFGEPRFIGANALREFNDIFDTNATGVPLEDYTAGTGSSFSHFSETVFGNELMSPFSNVGGFSEPMSRITVGLMQDIGYGVDYRGADFYDPDVVDAPTTTPLTGGGGLVDFSWTVQIDDASDAVQGQDFMSRINRRPTLDGLRSNDAFFEVGGIVKLRAIGASDQDSGDSVTAVKFYVESNNLEGLQLGTGGDTFIGTDDSPDGGFRISARTGMLALPAGETTFYARPLDNLLVAGKPRPVTVTLFDPDSPPRKPSVVTSTPRGSSEVLVSWTDRSNNEFGFRIERSRDEFFTRDVRRLTVAANVESFVDGGLDAGTRFFYRVRAFNVGGSSNFAGPSSVITLSPGEVIVDDSDTTATSYDGAVTFIRDGGGRGGSYASLSGAGAIARFAPQLTRSGEYYLYAAWRADAGGQPPPAGARFSVTDIEGDTRFVDINQNARGRSNGEVLLGKFSFRKGQRTVVHLTTSSGNTVTIDQLRFVPIG